jgi:hypothetical protein
MKRLKKGVTVSADQYGLMMLGGTYVSDWLRSGDGPESLERSKASISRVLN